jgi:hypothetical protein
MGLKERFGCFFLAIGSVTFLLFAVPIARAFRKNPQAVPLEWIGAAALGLLVIGTGWKLYRSARRSAASMKPPSLGARIAARRNSGETAETAGRRPGKS